MGEISFNGTRLQSPLKNSSAVEDETLGMQKSSNRLWLENAIDISLLIETGCESLHCFIRLSSYLVNMRHRSFVIIYPSNEHVSFVFGLGYLLRKLFFWEFYISKKITHFVGEKFNKWNKRAFQSGKLTVAGKLGLVKSFHDVINWV